MAINPAAVRLGIETRLATISGLQTRERVGDNADPPVAMVWLDSPVEFDEAMGRGLDMYPWKVFVLVCRADAEEAQTLLDPYVRATGSTSVKTAIEGDRTLGGTVSTCRVTRVADIDVFEIAGIKYLCAEFDLVTYG